MLTAPRLAELSAYAGIAPAFRRSPLRRGDRIVPECPLQDALCNVDGRSVTLSGGQGIAEAAPIGAVRFIIPQRASAFPDHLRIGARSLASTAKAVCWRATRLSANSLGGGVRTPFLT